jgi:aminoglycoside phosphotransferase (APT) family kinase protein
VSHTATEVTEDLIRDLLRDQQPGLAALPLTFGAKGWDNQLWRLGDDLAVRLPYAPLSADQARAAGAMLRKEHAWVPALSPRLPLPVPVPRYAGEPSGRFPHPWIVTTWVPGEPADRAPVTRGEQAADILAAFLAALHRPAPEGAPVGRFRGGPLRDHAAGFAAGLARAADRGQVPDPDAVRAVWEDAVAAPDWEGPRLWLHGDLHPANVLTRGGTLCGVIDFSDLYAGDPAGDLAAAWVLLPDDAVARFFGAYHPAPGQPALDAATLRRARGCAVLKAIGLLEVGYGGDHGRPGGKSTWGPPGRESLRRLVASAGQFRHKGQKAQSLRDRRP